MKSEHDEVQLTLTIRQVAALKALLGELSADTILSQVYIKTLEILPETVIATNINISKQIAHTPTFKDKVDGILKRHGYIVSKNSPTSNDLKEVI